MNAMVIQNKNNTNHAFSFSALIIFLLIVLLLGGISLVCVLGWIHQENDPYYRFIEKNRNPADLIPKDDPYCRFIQKNTVHGKPITEKELYTTIRNICTNDTDDQPLEKPLAEMIIDSLNIGFLLKDINSRPLEVTVDYVEQKKGYVEKKLSIHDDQVGKLEFLLLIPNTSEAQKLPVILGCHGHGYTPEGVENWILNAHDFKRNCMGAELAENGFIVAIPTFKYMGIRAGEKIMSKKLLMNGFTLLGIRVYESLLVLKFLETMDVADSTRVGALGHSGGNRIATLIGRLSNTIKCQVRDQRTNFSGINERKTSKQPIFKLLPSALKRKYYLRNVYFHCELVPQLAPCRKAIYDKTTLSYPILEVPYHYKDETVRKKILEFFKMNLMNSTDKEQ
ncbi:alpha/beta hydrolase family protein [Candidatus Omnitrophota bacterium]